RLFLYLEQLGVPSGQGAVVARPLRTGRVPRALRDDVVVARRRRHRSILTADRVVPAFGALVLRSLPGLPARHEAAPGVARDIRDGRVGRSDARHGGELRPYL